MAGMPKLEHAALDLRALRSLVRTELLDALDSIPSPEGGARGGAALVLDPSLSGPLSLVAEVREIKERGVDKIYHLAPAPLETECKSIVYFVRPELRQVEHVVAHLKQLGGLKQRDAAGKGRAVPRHSFTLFFVPRRSLVCEKVLEDEGVYPLLEIREFAIGFLALEDDVLSLEQPCFADCFLRQDHSVLHTAAAAIAKLEMLFGTIPSIKAKGSCAQQVVHLLQQVRAAAVEQPAPPQAQIGQLLIIDRDVDLCTPLCTELTYEGLIHQLFGIAHGYVDLQPELLGSSSSSPIKREMNNNDPLFARLRNLNFGDIGPLLNRLARGMRDGYEERHHAHTVGQIKDFMKKLPKLQQEHKSLSLHVALAEQITKVTRAEGFHRRLECEREALASGGCSAACEALVEDLAEEKEPLPSLLRLVCLFSVVGNGLRDKTLKALQSELLAAYGYASLAITFANLNKVGLLKRNESRGSWMAIKKALNLVVDDVPDQDLGEEPPDLSYVYAGYAPLSVRALHLMAQHAPTSRDDIFRQLPGPFHSYNGGDAAAATHSSPSDAEASTASPATPPITMVFFVGGCTFAEIAALRWLRRNDSPRREYLVATTHICDGNGLMESLIHQCESQLKRLDKEAA